MKETGDDIIFTIKIFTHVLTNISNNRLLILKKSVTELKPFKFASDLRKPHLSNSMRSKVIQLWMKSFDLAFAISTWSLTISLLLNKMSCVDCLKIKRASFMSPIVLWFVESIRSFKSKHSKGKESRKWQEWSGAPSLQSTSRSSTNSFPDEWRLWFNQTGLTLNIIGFSMDIYSFLCQ